MLTPPSSWTLATISTRVSTKVTSRFPTTAESLVQENIWPVLLLATLSSQPTSVPISIPSSPVTRFSPAVESRTLPALVYLVGILYVDNYEESL
jgi:hypothetical protein